MKSFLWLPSSPLTHLLAKPSLPGGNLQPGKTIPEYWVVNGQENQVFAFQLQEGRYQQCDRSLTLKDLPIVLLEQTLTETNGSAALWFQQQIQDIG